MRSERVHNAGSVPPLPGETCPEHLAYLSGALTTVDTCTMFLNKFFWGGDKQNKVLIKNVFPLIFITFKGLLLNNETNATHVLYPHK